MKAQETLEVKWKELVSHLFPLAGLPVGLCLIGMGVFGSVVNQQELAHIDLPAPVA